ncbi:MAG: 2-iminoacetate synthase ThiH [Candidatus Margulisiibacteriota bacterium]|jgi:2-iminoacetate synthase
MTFSDYLSKQPVEKIFNNLNQFTEADVQNILKKDRISTFDLPILISPSASKFLKTMAQKAEKLTRQRFGHTMQIYVPLYLSNFCTNKCLYCGFNTELKYQRTILSEEEIVAQGRLLSEKGFKHLLLLTGEAPKKAGVKYIENALRLLKPYFSYIGLEIHPIETADYQTLIAAGADALTIYQETYHQETYQKMHLQGKKADYNLRLNTPDQAGKANFYQISIGALLGLYDWRFEAINLMIHLNYLKKNYWQVNYGLSFPRIQKMAGDFEINHLVSDTEFVQMMLAFRLCFPELSLNLSTREPSHLRDALVNLGITSISAESKTSPLGYLEKDDLEQFATSDNRSLEEIKTMLAKANLEPVLKDWDDFH